MAMPMWCILFVLVASALATSPVRPKPTIKPEPKILCLKNERYVRNDSACRLTCANRNVQSGRCKPFSGCVCKQGYVRLNDDATGPCVTEDRCPPTCAKGEHYVTNSSACEKTCANRDYIDRACACAPSSKCVCSGDLVRLNDDATGPCVSVDQCPTQCPSGEYFVNNTVQCEKTCDNRKIYSVLGPCAPFSKCFCERGLIRLNKDGPCAPEHECPPSDISCGYNEEYRAILSPCPPDICATRYVNVSCNYTPGILITPGCTCRYRHLRDVNNNCIPEEECQPPPELPQCKGPNEVASPNAIICPPQTCDSFNKSYACLPKDPVVGCNCVIGHLRNASGICVPSNDCPPDVTCPENERYVRNTNICERTCDNRDTFNAIGPCPPYSKCLCKRGFIRLTKDGPCVAEDKCPPEPEKSCPENEVWSDDKIICPPQSCASIYTSYSCLLAEKKAGCNCIDGYLRDNNGVCIPSEKCPGPIPECGDNEVYTDRKISCPPQSCEAASGLIYYSCAPIEPGPGCICKDNYLRNASDVCIPSEECPPSPGLQIICGPNEVETDKKVDCPPQTCEAIGRVYECPEQKPERGCICKDGYLRNAKEECIPKSKCEKGPKKCQIGKACRRTCANRDNPDCAPVPPPKRNVDGCECKRGYILKEVNGKCIPEQDCPKPSCPANETFTRCKLECPLHYCPVNDVQGILVCDPPFPCSSGCICQQGFLRKSYEEPICIDAATCPPVNCTRPNEAWNPAPSACLAERCEDAVNPKPCLAAARKLLPRCTCKEGFYKNDSNICVPVNECPGYNYTCDKNSTLKNCPSACPATCDRPSQGGICSKMCLARGCECNPGYVLHEGKCIQWKDCPPVACGKNEIYVYCKAGCPTDYCPVNDGLGVIACSPPYPCLPGCVCASGYKKKSQNEPECIKASECPAVNCTRPNEVWNPSPPNCITDKCRDLSNPQPCNRPYPNNTPQCVCQEGFYRNDSNICVPATECGITCPANETFSACGIECPTVYCPSTDSRAKFACSIAYPCPPGCICQAGYRRKSREEKTCVKPSDCPPVQCTRPNEEWNPSPPDCIRESCDDVLSPQPCKYPYPSDPQCLCKQGYYRNASDICVPVMECGITCPANQTFVFCNARCPTDYCPVDDSRAIIACDPPYPCPPGCACSAGYKRKSENNPECIKASECPPVTCTRPNEEWNPTPPNCIRDRCEDAANPQPCDLDYPKPPQCTCKKGYYRNESDICIKLSECPRQCPVPAECRPTCAVPNPPNCPASSPATTNVDGCECQAGYVLSAEGKCIKIEECPQNESCNGDPHARIMANPWSCPATCDSPQASTCDKKPDPVGCVCESGYIFSEKGGKCILPENCPGGDPCGPNGTYVDCGFRCPNQYCPKDDSGIVYACKPGRPCPPGCACKINHLRKSNDDDRCILASDCPPVECTRPNEVWDSCPSDCLAEQCENVNDPKAVCNTLLLNCQPKCVCQENYYRNSSGICIPAADCPIPPQTCSSECTPTCAVPNPPNCPPQTDLKKPCCENGFILSEKGGKCIPIDECPKTGCNGDPNAVIRRCPVPCVPSTCAKPEAQFCPTPCYPGCECAPGYILSDYNGTCIKVDQCPGGDPCKPNAFFANCKSSCPTDYCPVDDNRGIIVCETYPFAPCLSGCVCKLNHKLNNREEKKCIVSSDCPPVKCTRPNEVWNSCPSECQSEYCEAAYKKPVVCNTLVLNCQPRCSCRKNYFRNGTDICIPRRKCPLPKKQCDD